MKRLPSASKSQAPSPRTIKTGVRPTAFQARTGELTAPGIFFAARAKRAVEFLYELFIATRLVQKRSAFRQSINRDQGSSGSEWFRGEHQVRVQRATVWRGGCPGPARSNFPGQGEIARSRTMASRAKIHQCKNPALEQAIIQKFLLRKNFREKSRAFHNALRFA